MDPQISPPPINQPNSPMNFYDALKLALETGSKIHKIDWEDNGYYGYFDGDTLTLHKPDGTVHNWIINEADIRGEDWLAL